MGYLAVGLALSALGIASGLFIFFRPALIIELQIKFYERINWRMEPISMPKELKNTKAMGLCLVLASLLGIAYIKFIYK